MLSDCTDMVGGETALRTAAGDVMKVRGPQMVIRCTEADFKVAADSIRGVLSSCKAAISLIKHFVL